MHYRIHTNGHTIKYLADFCLLFKLYLTCLRNISAMLKWFHFVSVRFQTILRTYDGFLSGVIVFDAPLILYLFHWGRLVLDSFDTCYTRFFDVCCALGMAAHEAWMWDGEGNMGQSRRRDTERFSGVAENIVKFICGEFFWLNTLWCGKSTF